MTANKCWKSDQCDSPLCPLDGDSLKFGAWYPDESFCRLKSYAALPWVRAQKMIARAAARMDHYFNLRMLDRGCDIKAGLAGLDPNSEDEAQQLKVWLKKHRRRRIHTEGK